MSISAVNIEANTLAVRAISGYIRIYDGTRPADADTAVDTQVLLAELRFGSPAFGLSVDGIITAEPITPEDAALAGGTASWARILESDGTTTLWDDEVGTVNSNIALSTVNISAGTQVSLTNYTHTIPRSA